MSIDERELDNAAERLHRLMKLHLPGGEIRPGAEVNFEMLIGPDGRATMTARVGKKTLYLLAENGRAIARAKHRGAAHCRRDYFRHGRRVKRASFDALARLWYN